jgi:hypothetical protein
MRDAILRDLAVQSLKSSPELEVVLDARLLDAARAHAITLHEFVRERLLLKSGVVSAGALAEVLDRAANASKRSGAYDKKLGTKASRTSLSAA